MEHTPETDQKFLDIFYNRLKKIGINIELWANYPWIYIHSINGIKVTEKFEAEHGFTIAFFPVNRNNPPHFTDISTIFRLIRQYSQYPKKPKYYIEVKQENNKINMLFSSDCGKFGTNEILDEYTLTPLQLLKILQYSTK